MPKHTVIFETVFTLHDNHTPQDAVKLVENNMKPLMLKQTSGTVVETTITAGVGDSDWVFTPAETSETTVGDYCVQVATSVLTEDVDSLEDLNFYVEPDGEIISLPTIDEELGDIFTDEVKVLNGDGELIFP